MRVRPDGVLDGVVNVDHLLPEGAAQHRRLPGMHDAKPHGAQLRITAAHDDWRARLRDRSPRRRRVTPRHAPCPTPRPASV